MNSKRCPIYYIVYAIYLHAHTLYNVADQRFEMLRYSGPVSGFADSFGLLHSFARTTPQGRLVFPLDLKGQLFKLSFALVEQNRRVLSPSQFTQRLYLITIYCELLYENI